MKRFEKLKENAAKELVTMAAKIQQAETYDEAYDLWDEFSNRFFTDLTGESYICSHCSQGKDNGCDCNCDENCKTWLEEEITD